MPRCGITAAFQRRNEPPDDAQTSATRCAADTRRGRRSAPVPTNSPVRGLLTGVSPITHFFLGWAVANSADLNRRERACVAIAGVIPDADGLGIVAEVLTRNSAHPLAWFSDYH